MKIQSFSIIIQNHGKSINTIWRMHDKNGEEVTSFEGIANVEVNHFKQIFRNEGITTIVEVVRTVAYFPSFVEEGNNVRFVEEISKDELKTILYSFQKIKAQAQMGGLWRFS